MAKPEPVRLVRMSDEHLAATCRWLRDSRELRDQVDCLTPPTAEGNAAYWRSRWRDPSREDYAVVAADGTHIGNCGLCDVDPQRRKAQLWIYLGESQGAGRGASALEQLLARAFGGLGLNRVYLRVIADNSRAIRFYRKFGFAQEGCARQDSVRGERYVDAVLMGLLAAEFHARSGTGG